MDLKTELRGLLNGFWDQTLEIEPLAAEPLAAGPSAAEPLQAEGVALAMPMSYPDGWQVTMELRREPPSGFRLSDRGKTLSWLAGRGQDIGAEAVRGHIGRLCREHAIAEAGGVLFRRLKAPIDPAALQVFAEGLVAVSRLDVLRGAPRMAAEQTAAAEP